VPSNDAIALRLFTSRCATSGATRSRLRALPAIDARPGLDEVVHPLLVCVQVQSIADAVYAAAEMFCCSDRPVATGATSASRTRWWR